MRFASNTCVKTLRLRLRYLKKKKMADCEGWRDVRTKRKLLVKSKGLEVSSFFGKGGQKKKHFFRVWEDLIRAAREKLLGGVRAWIPRASEKKIFRDEAEIL